MIDLDIKDEWGGIDEKIKPLVFELNRLEIPTSGSCEGHSGHGFPSPWVSIHAPQEIKTKVESLLNEFYSCRNADPNTRLSLMDGHGSFWIYSGGDKFLKFRDEINTYATMKAAGENPEPRIITDEEKVAREKVLPAQQKEISDFVIFLKSQTIL